MSVARMAPPDGARLTRIGQEIWVADRELILPAGPRLPVRMVVLRDGQRRLLCYSPVAIDAETREALEGLGEVAWLAIPNRLHRGFLRPARETFHRAEVVGCTDHGGDAVRALPEEGQIGGFVDFRVVRTSARFAELVLYHDASETLVVSDLIQNITVAERRLKWWLKINGAWSERGEPRIRRMLHLRDHRALQGFYRWAMARPFRQISVSHGGIIREGAREIVYRLFRPSGGR